MWGRTEAPFPTQVKASNALKTQSQRAIVQSCARNYLRTWWKIVSIVSQVMIDCLTSLASYRTILHTMIAALCNNCRQKLVCHLADGQPIAQIRSSVSRRKTSKKVCTTWRAFLSLRTRKLSQSSSVETKSLQATRPPVWLLSWAGIRPQLLKPIDRS